MYREIILSKILDYIRLRKIPHKGASCLNFHCPFCDAPGMSANVIPHTSMIKCYGCDKTSGKKYNLIDLARKIENLPDANDEEVLTVLRNLLNLNVTTQKDETEISKVLDKYLARGWCLVPCAKASPQTATDKIFTGKEPIQKGWQNLQNRDKAEWFHWINSGLNVGVRTGQVSNLCVIDLDFLSKEDKATLVREGTSQATKDKINAKKVIPDAIKNIMGETLMQETLGGFHLFYQATDLPKGSIEIENIHVDIETENGQVVIFPSFKIGVDEEYKDGETAKKRIVGYAKRNWVNDLPIIKMPQALYDLLKQNKVKDQPASKEVGEDAEIEKVIETENFKVKDFKNNRHNTMVKVGGILRKRMNILQVKDAMSVINNCFFEEPLPKSELGLIVDSLDKYINDEEAVIIKTVVDFLVETDVASKTDIELAVFGTRAIGENKVRFERALTNLLLQHKISKCGLRNYKLIKEMPEHEDFLNVGTPIDFQMPYFNDYAHFHKGDLILVGAKTKIGKTTLAMNFVKRLVQQGVKPIYLYNESGGRFGKTAIRMGLKPGDFGYSRATKPEDIIIKPNRVYVYDWIRVSDFARTADVFDSIVQKLEEANSTMIGFTQLRDGSVKGGNQDEWFAKDLLRQFIALSAKYLYTDKEGINNKFELGDIRDRKSTGKNYVIACKYIEETREVKTQEELDEEDRKNQNGKTDKSNDNNQEGTGIGAGAQAS